MEHTVRGRNRVSSSYSLYMCMHNHECHFSPRSKYITDIGVTRSLNVVAFAIGGLHCSLIMP